MPLTKKLVFTIAILTLGARSVNAEVSHHKITGVYNAQTVIAYKEIGGQATVKDRVELELDWDISNQKIMGPVTITNVKSETTDFRNVERSCPAPAPKGEYEHIDVTEVVDEGSGQVILKGTRTFPEVAVTADCQGAWHKRTVPPKKEEVTEWLAMIDLDEGEFTVPDEDHSFAWTWSYVAKKKGGDK